MDPSGVCDEQDQGYSHARDWKAVLSATEFDKFERLSKRINEEVERKGGDDETMNRRRSFLTDHCLLRYLRARSWDVTKAQSMLLDTLDWRDEFRPDSITRDVVRDEASTGKMFITPCMDKEGRPIVVMRAACDYRKDREMKLKFLVYILEEGIARMNENEEVERMTWLVDLGGIGDGDGGGPDTGDLSTAKDSLAILQNHYPERLGMAFFLRAPWLFRSFFGILRWFLNSGTKKKIQFVTDEELSKLQDYILPDQLPIAYGGTSSFEWDLDTWMGTITDGEGSTPEPSNDPARESDNDDSCAGALSPHPLQQ